MKLICPREIEILIPEYANHNQTSRKIKMTYGNFMELTSNMPSSFAWHCVSIFESENLRDNKYMGHFHLDKDLYEVNMS